MKKPKAKAAIDTPVTATAVKKRKTTKRKRKARVVKAKKKAAKKTRAATLPDVTRSMAKAIFKLAALNASMREEIKTLMGSL